MAPPSSDGCGVVLGIDPSLCNTGIAVLELRPEGERVLALDVVRTAPSPKKRRVLAGDDNVRRVNEIASALDTTITRWSPVAIVVEAPAGSKGAQAARALALALATVVTVAHLRRLPLVHVQPLDVKRAMCGRKAADKGEIIAAVECRFPGLPDWPEPPSVMEHAADAVGAVIAALDSDVILMARRLPGAA